LPPKRSGILKDYQRKRDFQRTPEPKPKKEASTTGRLFVVQKHRAQRLHYDFRLELDGVLLSWAVPKGPSLDPSEKRLAVQVEDHPIEYGGFEGIIPEDEYGGGTVMLWDRGDWSPLSEPRAAIEKGTLKFKLEAQKLRGDWTLVRMKEKGSPSKNWLLIKERDDESRDEDSFSIIDEEPFSAVTARTIAEIASAKDSVWTKRGATGALPQLEGGWRRGLYSPRDFAAEKLESTEKAKMPRNLTPPRPKIVESVPTGDDWVHEIVQVGKRLWCFLEEGHIRLQSIAGEDWTWRLPRIARAVARLHASTAVLDGVLSDSRGADIGVPPTDTADLRYHIFDLPYCDGHDLRSAALLERKGLLHKLLEGSGQPLVYCDHVEGRGKTVLAEAKRLGAPGIISKQAVSKYSQKDSANWRVMRLADEHETDPPTKPRRSRATPEDPEVSIAGIKLTHPNRVLYPEERVTKRMVAEYFEAVAPSMLPHVGNRPLSLYRCPGGIEKDCFFQKQLGEMSSQHLRGTESEGDPYVVLDDARGLVTLAQWNALEIHGWGCREDDLDHPDIIVFDLDPGPDVPWELIVEGAKGLRHLLKELHLESFVKTSGGKGLHVVVPLARPRRVSKAPSSRKLAVASRGSTAVKTKGASALRQDWDDVKDFAARVARKIAEVAPKHFTVFMSKPERRGKVFIDYHRNHRGSTCVVPYSTRARPGCFVSTPLIWDELDGPQPQFHIFEVLGRLEHRVDPWHDIYGVKQRISPEAANWLRG